MEPILRPDTTLCISVAERPSTFGYTLFNAAFKHHGLNMAYKPFIVKTQAELESVIQGMHGMTIRGCGVSMPHKTHVMKYVDSIETGAARIGAINTIVNNNGKLFGYNTDYEGAKELFSGMSGKTALVLGNGGVAKAVVTALKDVGARVTVSARSGLEAFARDYATNSLPWDARSAANADLLVNCTPIGMTPNNEAPICIGSLVHFGKVADLVSKPPKTKMILAAEALNIPTIPGYEFTLRQAAKQYELYTEKPAPLDIMRDAMEKLIK